MKELSEKHKSVAALLAQGLPRITVAQIVEFTPEYITMLQNQPLFQAYLREMTAAANVQIEALFVKSADVLAETLSTGSEDGKLKAVKLQGELTGRIGRGNNEREAPQQGDRLDRLAERLVSLLQTQRKRVFENGEVSEAQVLTSEER